MDSVAPPARELALLSQLTACAQQPALLADAAQLTDHIVSLLRHGLACEWAALALLEQGTVSAQAGWGLPEDQLRRLFYRNGVGPERQQPVPTWMLPLQFGGEPIGQLALGPLTQPVAIFDDTFLQTLADQIALLFGLHQNHIRERLATTLADVTLDLVGQLDTRALFYSILRHGVRLIDGAHGALYRTVDGGAVLELVAIHGQSGRDWEEQLLIGEGVAGMAAARRETLIIPDVGEVGALEGSLAVPLLLQSQVLGVIELVLPHATQAVTPIQREMVETFAAQAALVLRNARLFEEEQQRSRELFTLFENSRVIESAQRLEPMLDRLAENIALALQCDRALLYGWSGTSRRQLGLLASYHPDGLTDPTWAEDCQEAPAVLVEAARQPAPLAIEDVRSAPHLALAEALQRTGFRSALLLPLKVRERGLGLLCVGRSLQRHGFSRSEVNLAQTLAGQVASAIANAQIDSDKQRRIAEIDLLHLISRRLSEDLSLDETLAMIVDGIADLVPFDAAAVALHDADQNLLVDVLLRRRGGEQLAPQLYPPQEGLKGWLARHRRPLRLGDVLREAPVKLERPLIPNATARSYLGAPLLLDGQFVGAIELASTRSEIFSEADERLLTILASQLTQAIGSARRYQQHDAHLRARVLQLASLQRVGRQLTSTLFLSHNLEFVLNEAVRATQAASGMIVLRDLSQLSQIGDSGPLGQRVVELFQVMAATGYSDEARETLLVARLGADDPVIAQVLRSSNFMLVDEMPPSGLHTVLYTGSQSLLAMPIFYEAQVVGLVNLLSPEPHAFDHDALEFVRALADHTALAIGNAQRYEEQRAQRELLMRRARILNEVLQIGQAQRGDRLLTEVLEQIAFAVVETTNYREVVFNLLDDQEPELLRTVTGAGLPLSDLERMRQGKFPVALALRYLDPRFRIQHCYFVPAAEVQQLALGPSIDTLELESADPDRDRIWQQDDLLLVPLYSTMGQLLGVMQVSDPIDAARPTTRDVEPLEIFADQAAIKVENAALLQQARERADQMAALYQVGQAATSTLDSDELLERVYQQIVRHMGQPTYFYVATYDQPREQIRFDLFKHNSENHPRYHRASIPKGGLGGWVIDHNQPRLIRDWANDPVPPPVTNLTPRPGAWIGVPLRSLSGVIGVLSVASAEPFAYDEQDMDFLLALGNQLAVALENARLFQAAQDTAAALQARVGELATLLEAARVLSSSLEPQQVLSSLMEVVGRHLQVTTVALWTIRDTVLTPSAMLGIPDNVARGMRVMLGTGLTGRVAVNGKPLVVEDVEAASLSLYPSFNREHNLQSYLGVPVVYQERIVGVLSVMTMLKRSFSDDEVALLSGLADQAAIALENARLFAERERQLNELRVLNEIGQALTSTLDLQQVLEQLHDRLGQVLDVSTSLIGLYDADRDLLSYPIAYDRGRRKELAPLTAPTGAHGWVLRHRQPLLLQTEAQGLALGFEMIDEDGAEGESVESLLIAPVLAGERVLGVVSIQSYQQFAFSDDDLRFLTTVANQAAAALTNARLFAETRQSVSDLQTLYDNSVSLAGTLDPQEAQLLVVTSLVELMHADFAALFLLDRQGDLQLQVAIDAGGNNLAASGSWQGNGLNARLLESDQPLTLTDYRQEASPNEALLIAGVRGLLGIAIGTREQRLGTLWLATNQPRAWTEREKSLLSIFATQASQALENVRLFQSEQARRRLADTLREVARTLTSTLALDEIQNLILEQLAQVVHYDSASIMLRDRDEIFISACRGFDPETTQRVMGLRFRLDDDPHMLQIVETRQPLLLSDAQTGEDFVPIEGTEYIRGWIGAPILLDNEAIGVLTVDSHQVDGFDEEDANVAIALASQGAQAIRNGRLFEELRRARDELEQRVIERTADLAIEKERLEVIHTITLELTATLDLEEILQKTLRLIAGAVGVRRASIMLREPSQGELICRAVLHEDGLVVSANQPIRFGGGEGLAGWVMRHQESVLIRDVREDERWIQEPGRADDIRALAAVPLISADEPLGVLILSSTEVDYFGEDHLRLLSTIANEVAIALYNAELYSWLSDIANKLSEALTTQREENSKTSAILLSVSEGVIVLDERMDVTLVNPAAEKVLGIPAESVVNKPFARLEEQGSSDEQRERLQAIYRGLWESINQAAERGGLHTLVIELMGQTVAVNIAPVLARDGTNYGTVAVLRDITREIEADRIKRDFVSTVSHELRTPLTSIRGYVDLLLLGAAGTVSENQLAFLNVVKTNANRLMDLINDILAISSIETGKVKLAIEPFEIDAVIREVYQSLKVEVEKKAMTVTITMAQEMPAVEGDRRRITQVVTNLFSNAVKYTYAKGRIDIRAFLNPGGMLQVDVQDNGVGITPEQQKLLFSRFYRADNPLRDEAGGTGLGLSIAKSYVELHGGEMWVNSIKDEGSTFSFVLPLEQPRREEEEQQ